MAVIDDVRRLSQLDFIFLGQQFASTPLATNQTVWHKGRVQQANLSFAIAETFPKNGVLNLR